MAQKILLTGGAGYIGSHTYLALVQAGFEVVILDNFENADPSIIPRLQNLGGKPVTCLRASVLDKEAVARVFQDHTFDAVVHFAAKKAVGESTQIPLTYLDSNVQGLLVLLKAMEKAGVFRLVFSSSATVYGVPDQTPTPEDAPYRPKHPYAMTKVIGEQILAQTETFDPRWAFGVLRYFNPAGAHRSGMIGEDPQGIPNNLMPYISKVAAGELEKILVHGNDWPTPDGTGIRDYIHVEDLAHGHVLSLQSLLETGEGHIVNLGAGQGSSVIDVLLAYSRACGRDLPYEIGPRRAGDVAVYCADPQRAKDILGFEVSQNLDDMCASSWNWVAKSCGR